MCGGQTSPQKPRLAVSHSTCPPLSSPNAHSFVLGTAVINNNNNGPTALATVTVDGRRSAAGAAKF